MQQSNNNFTENDIRPDKYAAEELSIYEEDINNNLLSRKVEFVEVGCPACAKKSFAPEFQKYTLQYVRCNNCQTVFINPRPTPEILEYYYANSRDYKFWNEKIFPESEPVRREKIFKPRAELVRDLCKKHDIYPGVLVDVGAGFGTFCEEIKKLNYFRRVIAVEPGPSLAETCKKRGIETVKKPIEEASFDEPVDMVASFEVIEHLFSPEEFLKNFAKVLKPGGLAMIACPNIKGFDVMVLREISYTIDAEHLNYFHPKSLKLLFERCGFEVIDILTPGKLDAELVRKKALSGEFDIAKHPFLKQVLINEWDRLGAPFQQFLADNLLSSHLLMVAKKCIRPDTYCTP